MSKKGTAVRMSQAQVDDHRAKMAKRPAAPAAAPAGGLQRFQSIGRMPADHLNKTEREYAGMLELAKLRGEIVWWKAHPFNVRLADSTFYRIDFLVMTGDMRLEIHETKGGYTTEKGQMKIKLCAEVLPVMPIVKMTKLAKKDGGGWKREEF